MNGKVIAIFISPAAGEPMQEVQEVKTLAGKGLEGDRYAEGGGSFNRKKPWWKKISLIRHFFKEKRQVTLINGIFFEGSGFEFRDSRRNIITENVELMRLIGREFQIGTARFRGRAVKGYCEPCDRPGTLSGNQKSFEEAFFDRGGLIAEVIEDGIIKTGDLVIPPPKGY